VFVLVYHAGPLGDGHDIGCIQRITYIAERITIAVGLIRVVVAGAVVTTIEPAVPIAVHRITPGQTGVELTPTSGAIGTIYIT
jgi:hypothetical protein